MLQLLFAEPRYEHWLNEIMEFVPIGGLFQLALVNKRLHHLVFDKTLPKIYQRNFQSSNFQLTALFSIYYPNFLFQSIIGTKYRFGAEPEVGPGRIMKIQQNYLFIPTLSQTLVLNLQTKSIQSKIQNPSVPQELNLLHDYILHPNGLYLLKSRYRVHKSQILFHSTTICDIQISPSDSWEPKPIEGLPAVKIPVNAILTENGLELFCRNSEKTSSESQGHKLHLNPVQHQVYASNGTLGLEFDFKTQSAIFSHKEKGVIHTQKVNIPSFRPTAVIGKSIAALVFLDDELLTICWWSISEEKISEVKILTKNLPPDALYLMAFLSDSTALLSSKYAKETLFVVLGLPEIEPVEEEYDVNSWKAKAHLLNHQFHHGTKKCSIFEVDFLGRKEGMMLCGDELKPRKKLEFL